MRTFSGGLVVAIGCLLLAGVASAADVYGLKEGTPDLKSAGPMAFGPEGILFVGDTKGAAVFAIRTGDKTGDPSKVQINLDDVPGKLGEQLGASAPDIQINDMIVNPFSGNVYFSVSLGSAKAPALARVEPSGKVTRVSLDKLEFAKVELPNAPEDAVVGEGPRQRNRRNDAITDLAYVDGRVLVSGLSSAQAASSVRAIAFPFSDIDEGSSLEIFHGAHGRLEDNAPIRTFIPFVIDGEPHVLAGFVCTPLVKFPLKSIGAGERIKGTTVAELGNRNVHLDMIAYKKAGKSYLLMANSARGVMKVSTEDIGRSEGINARVEGTAGQKYDTIESLKGTVQLDRLNEENAVVLVRAESGATSLKTVPLP